MFKNIFRIAATAENIRLSLFKRNPRPRGRFQNHSASKTQYIAPEGNVIFQKVLPDRNISCKVLLSGIFAFLGLTEEVEEEPELIMMIKRAVLSIQRGELQRAERLLHDALKLAYSEKNEDGITYIYDLLANLALDTGQHNKAEKLFLHVMERLLSNGYDPVDVKILHISLKLSKIYENIKDYQKAETGYKYCKDNLKNKVINLEESSENYENTMNLWITTLDNYARFLVGQKRPTEAMENFQEAYKVCVEVNGKEHEHSALLLNDLGTTSYLLGDLEYALSYVEEAVRIGESIPNMENLYLIYISLGYIYIAKEMYNEAKSACKRGLRFARKDEVEDGIYKGKECLKEIEQLLKENKK